MTTSTTKGPAVGPDYSHVTSREAAYDLVRTGELVAMLMLPEMFGGDARAENIIFVPPFAVEAKQRTDENVVRPMVAAGKVIHYEVKPIHAGKSFVPIFFTVHAYEPGHFLQMFRIWGEGLSG
jgi:hypothetical protein